MTRPCYISRPSVCLGEELTPLEELEEVREAGLKDHFREQGLATVRVSERQIWELAVLAARDCLPETYNVGALIFSSITGSGDRASRLDGSRIATALGLTEAFLLGVGLHDCANFGAALHVAAALIAAGTTDDVLVVSADKAKVRHRLIAGELGLFSDGAAAFLVSSTKPDYGWQVLGIETANDRTALTETETTAPVSAASMTRQIATALRGLARKTGVRSSAYSLLLANNYITDTKFGYGKAVGIPAGRVYDQNRSAVGHCYAADPVIDLHTIARDGAVGHSILVVACGPRSWNFVALEAVQGASNGR